MENNYDLKIMRFDTNLHRLQFDTDMQMVCEV